MSLVTIIIPNYNHAKYLSHRIESILNQTFDDFEIIILDDASTDDSKDIIEKYKHHPKVLKIIYNNINSGSVFKQWEKGIGLANSPFIWIAESDDWAHETLLGKLYNKINSSDDIGLVYSDVKIMNSEGYYSGKCFSDLQNTFNPRFNESFINDGKNELSQGLAYRCTINNVSSVLFRTNFLKSKNIQLSNYYYAGDWATYVCIAAKSKIAYLHEPLSFYRKHDKNASIQSYSSGRIQIDNFRVVSYCYNYLFESQILKKQYVWKNFHQVIEAPMKELSIVNFFILLKHYAYIDFVLFSNYIPELIKLLLKKNLKSKL